MDHWATIANATVFLISLNPNIAKPSDVAWTAAILLVGLLIGTVTTLRNKDIPYGLVIV